MNHKDKIRGHKSSESEITELFLKYFCSLQPNFLASLEFPLNLLSNIFHFRSLLSKISSYISIIENHSLILSESQ